MPIARNVIPAVMENGDSATDRTKEAMILRSHWADVILVGIVSFLFIGLLIATLGDPS